MRLRSHQDDKEASVRLSFNIFNTIDSYQFCHRNIYIDGDNNTLGQSHYSMNNVFNLSMIGQLPSNKRKSKISGKDTQRNA